MTTPRTSSRSPDLVSLETLSLGVADDFFQSPGDCSPFDIGPGAPSLSSPDDTPFDLALSISEGGGEIFDLTFKESGVDPSSISEAFLSGGTYLSEEHYPDIAPLAVPFAVVSSSPTVDVPTLTTCARSNTPSKPKAEATLSGTMVEAAFSASNPTKQAHRVLRRSPRRSSTGVVTTATSTPTVPSTQRPATETAVTRRSGVSTRRTAGISAAKVGVRDPGTGAAIGGVAVSGATNGGTKRVGARTKVVGTGTKMTASDTKKAITGTKKAVVVKKKAVAKRFNHQCQNCGRMFGDEGLRYHLRHSVCTKGKDTSKAVSSFIFEVSSCLALLLVYAI